jgi:integrase
MRHPKVREEIPPPGRAGGSAGVVMLERESAERLLTCLQVPVERRVRYLVGLLTGLRDGEIAGLRLERLHLNDPVPWLDVRVAFAILGDAGRHSLKEPKTEAGKRPLPLHPLLAEVLKLWVEKEWAFLVGRAPESSDPVLPRWDGTMCRPCSANLLRYDLALAGCPTSVEGKDLTFQALRHSFLTWLKEAGVSAEDRRALAGHAGRDVEERHYLAVRLPTLREAVARLVLAVSAADLLRRDKTTKRPRRERKGIRAGQHRRRRDAVRSTTEAAGQGHDADDASAPSGMSLSRPATNPRQTDQKLL